MYQKTNSLFLNFWVLDEKYRDHRAYGSMLFQKVFEVCDQLDFIIWSCPVKYIVPDFIDEHFTIIDQSNSVNERKSDNEEKKTDKLLYLHRSKFLPRLNVRNAGVEDNDELIPILEKYHPEVFIGQENNYFLADLIESQDEYSKFFVGINGNGKDSKIVGLLTTSTDVNVSLVTKIFDIDAFSDIVIQENDLQLVPPILVSIVGDIRLVDLSVLEEAIIGYNSVFIDVEKFRLDIDEVQLEEIQTNKLFAFINQQIKSYEQDSSKPLPPAFVVYGYPSLETDVTDEACIELVENFRYILELKSTSDDLDDEDDEFLQQHLDSLDLLRESYSKLGKGDGFNSSNANWLKIAVSSDSKDKASNVKQFITEFLDILTRREEEIEFQRKLNGIEQVKVNAFAVTLFAIEEQYQSRSEDLLRLAFEEQSDRNYCLFLVPNSKKPSLLTSCFTHVQTRAGLSFDQSLYVVHRSSFLVKEFLTLERLTEHSLLSFENFISPLPEIERSETIDQANNALKEVSTSLQESPENVCILVKISETVVGVVLLTTKLTSAKDLTWIQNHYNIEDVLNFGFYKSTKQAFITKWLLNPIYTKASKLIIREIMRLYSKTLLYYHSALDSVPPQDMGLCTQGRCNFWLYP